MNDFNEEPVIGHHVSAKVYEPDEPFRKTLEKNGIESKEKLNIEIEIGDVDWVKNQKVTMDVKTFEKMIDWYINEI